MTRRRKLSGAAVILLNEFQAKAEQWGKTNAQVGAADADVANDKDQMLKARYRLESYMNTMNTYAGQYIRLRKAAKKGERVQI